MKVEQMKVSGYADLQFSHSVIANPQFLKNLLTFL